MVSNGRMLSGLMVMGSKNIEYSQGQDVSAVVVAEEYLRTLRHTER